MKCLRKLVIVLFLLSTILSTAQKIGGEEPFVPQELITYNPPTGTAHNNRFQVSVKQGNGTWKNLYEYKTLVQKGSDKSNVIPTSFVQFDFSGSVDVKVLCSYCTQGVNSVVIRPLSEEINYTQTGNTIYFSLNEPVNLSIEVNGDRYRNMHIIASSSLEISPPEGKTPRPLDGSAPTGQPNDNYYTTAEYINAHTSGIPNRNGDRFYVVENNEKIHLEGGIIVTANIYIRDKENVDITGRGIIDLSGFNHYYSSEDRPPDFEAYNGISIRRSRDITVDGVIINDSQLYAINISESGDGETRTDTNIKIDNVKIFSNQLNGDGITMTASSNIGIKDSFIRTSDDCIAIYASRIYSNWELVGDARNITVENSSLYADEAHPITIGWHGSQDTDNKNMIRSINFNNIDILEHDEDIDEYKGTMSINCSDENRCRDITFKDVRIEDFTKGQLLNVSVESGGFGAATTNGYKVENVVFENISYNGSGEGNSYLGGYDCWRYVNGVHFINFKINGQLLNSLSDYNKFAVQNDIYDITFNNIPTGENVNEGIFRIKNKLGKSLNL